MRVALICPYAWDDPGGVQTHIRELAESLLARDHAVTVIAPVRHGAAQPWVSPVGRPVDIPYNASNAPIDPRPWSMLAGSRDVAALRTRRGACPRAAHPEHVDVGHARRPGSGGGDLPLGRQPVPSLRRDRAGAPQDRASHLDPGRGVGGRRGVRGLAHRRRVRDRAQRGGRVPVRRREARRSRSGHEALVRRAPRRAEGIPHRGRSLLEARRRASGPAAGRGG